MGIKKILKEGTADYNETQKIVTAKENIRRITWFANKTDAQLETYINNNVTNLATARDFLILQTKLMRRICLALDGKLS